MEILDFSKKDDTAEPQYNITAYFNNGEKVEAVVNGIGFSEVNVNILLGFGEDDLPSIFLPIDNLNYLKTETVDAS